MLAAMSIKNSSWTAH